MTIALPVVTNAKKQLRASRAYLLFASVGKSAPIRFLNCSNSSE